MVYEEHYGSLSTLMGWPYHKDEWAKVHPVFDGLPCGGMMDYAFYREMIPDALFSGQEPPAPLPADFDAQLAELGD